MFINQAQLFCRLVINVRILHADKALVKMFLIKLNTYSLTRMYLCLTAAKPVYVCGQLVYTVGMIFMAATRHPVAVIALSPCAGIMYATLFTMPYLLVARYHTSDKVTPCVVKLKLILLQVKCLDVY